MTTYTGSCLCGGVQFEVNGELAPIQICHCVQCRKAQGSALVTNIPVAASTFALTAGEELLRGFESTPGKQRVFCSRCGSPIYSRLDSRPEIVRLRAGTLDGDLPVPLQDHAWVSARANWWPICDDLPQLERGR